MLCKKSLKVNFLLTLLLASCLFPSLDYAQQVNPEYLNGAAIDTTAEIPTQYRRGIGIQPGFQSYEEKYFGKNLTEEKRRLFPLQSTGVWTELNPKVPRVDYLGINFVNKDTGWAVGNLGALIKTTNGGTSWTISETNTTTPILKVRSYDGQVVIASGFGGKILRSTDGGETFTQVISNVTGDLWGLQMLNDTLGWACGNGNSLTKTTDGGQTWQNIETPGYTSDYWWIDFLTESYGFIAANGKVLRTSDGGLNWEIIQAGDSQPLFSIDVIDSLHVAAAGYGGTGYGAKNIYSSDGGYTWINGGQITTESVNCIKYINADTGYIVLTEVSARKTTNRGQSWTIIGGIDDNYELQFFEEDNIGYSAGTVLKINKAEGNFNIWNRLILNDTFSGVYFTSESTGYVASRWFYKTTDSGINWIMSPNFPTNLFTSTLGSLTFTDSLTGFVGGPPCRIVKTTDAGETWYVTNRIGLTDTIGSINKIFFINHSTGWAVTSRGGILKTTNGGDNWFTQLNAPLSIVFSSIHFVDSLFGWTANGNARPYKTIDGGQNWVQQTNLNIWISNDIYFKNFNEGWIIDQTSWSTLKKTIDGGFNWSAISEILSPFKFHFFPDTNHWMINGGYRYITEDGGNTFIEITNDVPSGFNGFNAITDFLGFAVGGLGLILRYNDTSFVPVELSSFECKFENGLIKLYWVTASEMNNYGFTIQKSFNKEIWFDIGFVAGRGTNTEINYYSFEYNEPHSGNQYYRLKQQDYDGSFMYSSIIEIEILIGDFFLSQCFPNPANPSTTITFSIPIKTNLKINLYSVSGEIVREIINEERERGVYKINLNLSDLPSGVYFYRMITDNGFSNVKKMILIK
jgi:photosystem II stability/assembly factor-like uncharacterized protein